MHISVIHAALRCNTLEIATVAASLRTSTHRQMG
jgi:hypothetical protein